MDVILAKSEGHKSNAENPKQLSNSSEPIQNFIYFISLCPGYPVHTSSRLFLVKFLPQLELAEDSLINICQCNMYIILRTGCNKNVRLLENCAILI